MYAGRCLYVCAYMHACMCMQACNICTYALTYVHMCVCVCDTQTIQASRGECELCGRPPHDGISE